MNLDKLIELFKSVKDNPTILWGLIFGALGTIGTFSYNAITYYNQGKEMVTSFADVSGDASYSKRKVDALTEKVNAQAEVIMKLQEKTGDAYMLAREAKVVADSTQKESRSGIAGIKSELDIQNNSLRSEMNAIRRATVNPLSK